ncbi:MAG: SH3 domain-containing protein [Candidatus Omnitrophica bacterium]|nr:SH3 domain-containing protein [Candidatus Omnitrophota bacterium]
MLQGQTEEAPAFQRFVGSAATDNVYIRSGPNKNFEILHKLEKGEEVVVVEKQYDWFSVLLPTEARCFITKEFVTIARKESFVNADSVNLRSRPSISSSVIGQANIYDEVIIVDSQDNWYRIIPPRSARGWVHANFINKKERARDLRLENQKITHDQQLPLPAPQLHIAKQDDVIVSSLRGESPNIAPTIQKKYDFEAHKPSPRTSQTKPLSSQGPINVSVDQSPELEKTEPSQVHNQLLGKQITESPRSVSSDKKQTISKEVADSSLTQLTGLLEDAGRLWSRPGTHKLVDSNGNLLCYLKSDSIDLNQFVYHRVTLWGKKLIDSKHAVITVTRIESMPAVQ